MTILITGVAGLIGSRLADWISENHPNIQIIGIDNLSGGFKENIHDNVIFYELDLSSDPIEKCFTKHNINYVYHFAAYAAQGLSPFLRSFNYKNNILSTVNIINNCISHDVKRLVFTSSMAVYGNNIPPFDESYVPSPIDPYGVAKFACEMDIKIAGEQHGLDWCIIRPHNVYGLKQNIWDKYRNVLGIWMYEHINNKPMTIYGDGNQKRAFSYIDDCLTPLWLSSQQENCSKEIINLGSSKYHTINEANKILRSVINGGDVAYQEKRYEVDEAHSTHEKSARLLNYSDKTSLYDGLKSTWEWAQIQPNRKRKEWKIFEIDKGLYDFWNPNNGDTANKKHKPTTRIKIHNPRNEYTMHNRFYNDFWDEFSEYLKKFFIVEENRYYEEAHSTRYRVDYRCGTTGNYELMECEYAIENLDNGEFVIMSVSDTITAGVINENANPKFKKALVAQYLPTDINLHVGKYAYKYSPWTYFITKKWDVDQLYQKRLLNPPIDNRLYFKGTSLDDRTILNYFDKNIITNFYPISADKYFDQIIKHKIALSVDGIGELCYRDIECFAIGIPIIRFEYVTQLYDPLIPNYHYISIPRPSDMILYRTGKENHAKLLEQRYYEALNDDVFLKFIAKNAREYYLKNCTMESAIKNTYNLLNLNDWL
jgi:UDP-glucose 4-epimerase